MPPTRRSVGLVAAAATCALIGTGLPAVAEPAVAESTRTGRAANQGPDPRPFVQGTETVQTYDYDQAIRERVEVQVPEVDGDADGVVDQVTVDIIRPAEAAAAGIDVPVILLPSPYYRANDVDFDADGLRINFPDWTDNFFVPRGYAVAMVDLPGTHRSTGCDDVGGPLEVTGATRVVDWLNGRAEARTPTGGLVTADWSSGKTAMMGTSWDGTIDNAVAATGVEGLETIVPIAAISSWYDYTRSHGAVYYSEHAGFLQDYVSNDLSPHCDVVEEQVEEASDSLTGSFNDWWGERDYRPDASKVTASVYAVHGLNDENVKTGQLGAWWDELARHDVPRRLMLHQEQHVSGFQYRQKWVDEMHTWFDYWLQDLDNGAMDEPQALVMREDGSWTEEETWPVAGATDTRLNLSSPTRGGVGGISLGDGGRGPVTFTTTGPDNPNDPDSAGRSTDEVVLDPTVERSDRAVFLSDELTSDVRWSGTGTVRLRLESNQPLAGVMVRVVDYGEAERYVGEPAVPGSEGSFCVGQGNELDTGCFTQREPLLETSDTHIVSRTLADVGHFRSLNRQLALQPGRSYDLSFELQTDDAVFEAGHRLGLVVTADHPIPQRPFEADPGLSLTLDPLRSTLTLPLAGDTESLRRTTVGSRTDVGAEQLSLPNPETDLEKLVEEMVEASPR